MHPKLVNIALEHKNVRVRTIRTSDAKYLQQLLARDREWLSKWEASYPGYRSAAPSTGQLKSGIRENLKKARRGLTAPFVMLYKNEIVGQLSVSDISWGALQSGQIGYWISKKYAGKNITPTSVALVIDHMLKNLGLHRIEICLKPENKASRRVVEKLGLRFEGTRERYIYIDGEWSDHDCFAITSDELQNSVLSRLKA